jgi:hypothetical protein
MTDFIAGDYLAVWANTTAYEIVRIATVSNNTRLDIDASQSFTFAASGREYARVENDAFSNGSISVSDLKIDKLYFDNQAYNDIQQGNVARYHSINSGVYNGYDTFQVKAVMLSVSDVLIPKIDNIQGVGVSA